MCAMDISTLPSCLDVVLFGVAMCGGALACICAILPKTEHHCISIVMLCHTHTLAAKEKQMRETKFLSRHIRFSHLWDYVRRLCQFVCMYVEGENANATTCFDCCIIITMDVTVDLSVFWYCGISV